MTTVSLSELMTEQRAAVKASRPRTRVTFRFPTVRLMRFFRLIATIAITTGHFLNAHALVLAGCACFVTAATLYSPIAGLAVAGTSLFFLEARRR